jgi:hypothetical protein
MRTNETRPEISGDEREKKKEKQAKGGAAKNPRAKPKVGPVVSVVVGNMSVILLVGWGKKSQTE